MRHPRRGGAARARAALVAAHELPPGEDAKTVGGRRAALARAALDRDGTLVALGGGCTTDVAGFVAATYLRGVAWVAVPTTLVGQVDAAIGGKTGDRPAGRQEPRRRLPLAGADVIDPALLETLPGRERADGLPRS